MTSLFDQIGLKVNYYAALAKAGAEQGSLTREIASYAHETLAVGGYWTCDIGLTLSLKNAESWYALGLGRQIKAYTKSGKVWEGFVNQVQVNAGAVTETRGPVLDIGNRISATYTPVDFSVYPPVTGTETTTIITENLDSQAEFGIVEKVIAAGQCTDDTAEQLRDIQLQDGAWPLTSGPLSIAPGSAQFPAVTLNCLGNVHWLTAFIYEDLTPGYIILSDKLQNIVTADPNGYISTDFTNVVANNFLLEQMEAKGRFAFDIITELLNLGNDTNDYRRNFGVYNDRVVYYSAIPTDYLYTHRLSDPAQRVLDRGKRVVYPWAIRPGNWLFVPDFVPGFIPPNANLRSDPRWKFLESVRYSAPASLDLSGGKLDRLSQAIAKVSMNAGYL
jgi:hypothetical protein